MTPGELETALAIVESNFDGARRRRMISGIAISTAEPINGASLDARGHVWFDDIAVPLLLGHAPQRAIGFVRSLEERDGKLHFQAEIANSGRVAWADDAWEAILSRRGLSVSVCPHTIGAAYGRHFRRFAVRELSIVDDPADSGARILRAWSREPTVYLDGRPPVIEHWRAGPGGKRA